MLKNFIMQGNKPLSSLETTLYEIYNPCISYTIFDYLKHMIKII